MPPCRGIYNFNYDGLNENKIVVGKDICPGIYKVYVNVINNEKFYYLRIRSEKGMYNDSITISKKHETVNNEGKKFSFPINYYLDIPVGITSVKFIKQ